MSRAKPTSASPDPSDPDAIRRDIEETREQLAETVDQLAARLDVKARATSKVHEVRAQALGKVQEIRAQATGKVQDVRTQATGRVQAVRSQATTKAQLVRGQSPTSDDVAGQRGGSRAYRPSTSTRAGQTWDQHQQTIIAGAVAVVAAALTAVALRRRG
jgi:membrane-associated HD superfamily phosphohydrolase